MRNENWENIKNAFHDSLEQPSKDRDLYLVRVCGDDYKMLNEVRQLLAAYESNEDFLETGAVGEVADLIVGEPKKNGDGGRFGRYQIETLLGEGGMGRVFLAKDTELERFAALKILAPLLSKDEARVRRFVREAKAASSLNHPNILTIYEIGHAQDSHFIATEYVEGETLRQRQNRQPLDLIEILDIATQVASALGAAHQAGIIHRDIKPENIMLRGDGIVKVLDFGLAKLLENDSGNTGQSSENHNRTNTAPGIILGTAAYMSPEQARGKPVDARTDIWSYGACLYELITGSQPFGGETVSDVISDILTREPVLPSAVPAEFIRIIRKALQKDRADRYSTIEELLAELTVLRDALKEREHFAPLTAYRIVAPTAANEKATRLSGFTTTVFSHLRLYPAGPFAGIILCVLLGLAAFFYYQKNAAAPLAAPEAVRWSESGREAAQNGDYYKAKKLLEQAIQADDRFLEAHARLAEIQMELDYEDKAAQSLLRVTELMPQSSLSQSESDYLKAVLAAVRRDNHLAAATYEKIIAETPETEKKFVYFDLGRALEKTNAAEQAITAYTETVRRDPQFAAAFLRLGILYWNRRDETQGLASLDTAAAIYSANSNYDGLGELYYQKGTLYNYNDNLPEAEKNLKKALEIAQATSNLPLRIKTTLDLGCIGYSNGDTKRAQQLIDEALQMSHSENLENLTTNGLIDLGTLFYFRGEYEKSAHHLEQALEIARLNGGRRAEARAQLALGNLALLRVRPADAVRFIEPALNYYDDNDFRQEKSKALLALGFAYDQTGRYAPAFELFEKVLAQAKDENDQAMAADAESAIGLVLIHLERYTEAIERCEISFQLNQSLGREQIAAYALLNKAQALIQLGRFDEARQALKSSSAAAEKSQDDQLSAWIHLLLGKAALFEGRLPEAVAGSRKSLRISGGQVDEIIIAANITSALAELRRGSDANDFCRIAEETVEKIKDSRLLYDVRMIRSELYLKEKNASAALREALQAREHFAGQRAKYSEWRALAIAAAASSLLGDSFGAEGYARQSGNISAQLEQSWGADNFRSFRNRSDTIYYQSLIDKVQSKKVEVKK